MRRLKKALIRTPILGPVVLLASRARTASGYFSGPLSNLFRWLFTSRETTNFTYDLEANNRRYLASLLADVTGTSCESVLGYFAELENDAALRTHIAEVTAKSDLVAVADKEVRFGRRIGWYALVRILRPSVVIETGVDKGLGACVLAAALRKNQEDGFPGRYYGTDINPEAGYLFSGVYTQLGEILYGDSIDSLKRFEGMIDLFINDSDHSADYEAEEYETIAAKLSARAFVLGDNSHCTDKLLAFSVAAKRHFVFFQEKPQRHWYPGAGIGISFLRDV